MLTVSKVKNKKPERCRAVFIFTVNTFSRLIFFIVNFEHVFVSLERWEVGIPIYELIFLNIY